MSLLLHQRIWYSEFNSEINQLLSDPVEQYVYENAVTLDAATGWYNLRLSLGQVESDGSVNPNDQGFCYYSIKLGWLPKNNEILDYDKILSYGLTVVTTVNAADSVLVGFDNMEMFSPKSLPAIVFNGIAYGPQIVQPTWSWGQSTYGSCNRCWSITKH